MRLCINGMPNGLAMCHFTCTIVFVAQRLEIRLTNSAKQQVPISKLMTYLATISRTASTFEPLSDLLHSAPARISSKTKSPACGRTRLRVGLRGAGSGRKCSGAKRCMQVERRGAHQGRKIKNSRRPSIPLGSVEE